MSLDTHSGASSETSANEHEQDSARSVLPNANTDLPQVSSQQWDKLRKKIDTRSVKNSAASAFGEAVKEGRVYCWGLACARGGPVDDLSRYLSQLACDRKPSKKLASKIDLPREADHVIESVQSVSDSPSSAASAIVWAAALPALTKKLDQQTWWDLLSALQQVHEAAISRNQADSPLQLMLAVEVGLTLSWRLADLPSCKRLRSQSESAFEHWCRTDEDAITASIREARDVRLVMASLIRCRKLIKKQAKKSAKHRTEGLARDLATWVTALTTYTGGTAMSSADRRDVVDDLSDGGLLDQVAGCDPDALCPAMIAALGKSQTGGRLAWEVSLPEAMHLNEDAKLAVMMPDWDVRRGRTHIDFQSDDMKIEVFGGQATMLAGRWHTILEIDQEEQNPRGEWELTCEYTDDDVHYLEFEQPWSGGVILQRQFMMIRDDRCLMLADSIVPSNPGNGTMNTGGESVGEFRYISRLPMSANVEARNEKETREIFLQHGRNRAMVIPLAANEWRSSLSHVAFEQTPDRHLSLVARRSRPIVRACLD